MLESLKIITEHCNLNELEVKSKGFEVFYYLEYGYDPEAINHEELLTDLGGFLRRHRTIRHFSLFLEGYKRLDGYPDMFDVLIAENIPELETLRVVTSASDCKSASHPFYE